MKKAVVQQYSSEYGFKSPGFGVDEEGNITANSLTLAAEQSQGVVDYVFSEENDAIFVSGLVGSYPQFDVFKSRTLTIELQLVDKRLFLYKEDRTTLYSENNLIHSSGDRGEAAQGKSTGTLEITIGAVYNEDVLYYTDQDNEIQGTIIINDPIGTFGSLNVTGTTDSTNDTTGSLKVSGGVGIEKSLSVGTLIRVPEISSSSINVSNLKSESGLKFEIDPQIDFHATDSSLLGKIDDNGSTIPIISTTIDNSQINNTSIGLASPSTAKFTEAEVSTTPTQANDVANKNYTDVTATALAIALGS